MSKLFENKDSKNDIKRFLKYKLNYSYKKETQKL